MLPPKVSHERTFEALSCNTARGTPQLDELKQATDLIAAAVAPSAGVMKRLGRAELG
jgi:hypothetical protein